MSRSAAVTADRGAAAGDPGDGRRRRVRLAREVGELEGARYAPFGDLERPGWLTIGDRRSQDGAQTGAERDGRPVAEVVDVVGQARRADATAVRPVVAFPRAWTSTSASSPARRTASWTASSAVARSSGGTTADDARSRRRRRRRQQRAARGRPRARPRSWASAGRPTWLTRPPAGGRRRPGGAGRRPRWSTASSAAGQQQARTPPRPPTARPVRPPAPPRRRCRSGRAGARRPGGERRRRRRRRRPAAAAPRRAGRAATARISRRYMPRPRSRATSRARTCRSQVTCRTTPASSSRPQPARAAGAPPGSPARTGPSVQPGGFGGAGRDGAEVQGGGAGGGVGPVGWPTHQASTGELQVAADDEGAGERVEVGQDGDGAGGGRDGRQHLGDDDRHGRDADRELSGDPVWTPSWSAKRLGDRDRHRAGVGERGGDEAAGGVGGADRTGRSRSGPAGSGRRVTATAGSATCAGAGGAEVAVQAGRGVTARAR